MDVTFHIGLHKTGSTFLQTEVFPKIATPGFCFLGKRSDLLTDLHRDSIHVDPVRLRTQIEQHAGAATSTLISNEFLSGDPFNADIHRSAIAANIHHTFPNARIILFIRRQDEWARSNYLGSIRRGSNLSLPHALEPVLNPAAVGQHRYPNPTLDLFLYSPYLRRLKELFGDAHVLVLPYEALRHDCDRVVRTLCDFLGVERPAYANIKRNYSWGRRRVAFHRVLNGFIRSSHNPYGFLPGIPVYSRTHGRVRYVPLRRVLIRAGLIDAYDRALDRFDRPFVDRSGVCRRILAACVEDNRRIQHDFGINLEPYGYLDPDTAGAPAP